MEDCRGFFWPCRWINCPFTRIRVSEEGVVTAAEVASEAEDGSVPGGALVGREVRSVGVHHHCCIDLAWRYRGDVVIFFCMSAQNVEAAYPVSSGGVLCQWRRILSVAEAEEKREVGANFEEV